MPRQAVRHYVHRQPPFLLNFALLPPWPIPTPGPRPVR
jgi:hypothetical protein